MGASFSADGLMEPSCSGPARPTSGLARYLMAQQGGGGATADAGEALEASLHDVVDSVLRAEHAQSERRRPRARDLLAATSPRSRADLLLWMVQTFDILHFDDAVLHGVALTMDRYFACHEKIVEESRLQTLVLAALCVELKTSSCSDYPDGSWKRYLAHLCQGTTTIADVLRVEVEVLSRLGFVTGVPTPFSFLRGLAVRLRGDLLGFRLVSFGAFLLELALFDAELEYGGHSHSLLAAAALNAAFRALEVQDAKREELLADVAAFWPIRGSAPPAMEQGLAREMLLECEQDLLQLWLRSVEGVGPCAGVHYSTLQAKFAGEARVGRRLLAAASPARALRRLHEERALRGFPLKAGSGIGVVQAASRPVHEREVSIFVLGA